MTKPKRTDPPSTAEGTEPDRAGKRSEPDADGSSKQAARAIRDQVLALRGVRGVGSPDQMRASTDGGKAASLSEYTITIEGVFGEDASLIDADVDIDEELKRRDDIEMHTWTGAMGRDCVNSVPSGAGKSDRLRFDIPPNTSQDDFSFEHLRIYITSPSRVSYKMFEFDCTKMSCTNTDMWSSSGSSSTTKYNEYKSWKLPYKHKTPRKGLQLVVSLELGKCTFGRMLSLEWYSGEDQLEEAQVLAYLNGDKIKI